MLSKFFFCLLLLELFLLVLPSCCENGYSYSYQFIIIENLEDETAVKHDSIPAKAFGLNVNLVNKKMAAHPVSFNCVYAMKCLEEVEPVESINKIKIYYRSYIGNELTDKTSEFLFKSDIFSNGDFHPLDSLLSKANARSQEVFESFQAFPKNPQDFSKGKFIIEIFLEQSVLKDSTNFIRLF